MWTVVYVVQKIQEVRRICAILEENNIISRTRQTKHTENEEGMCVEILVPAAELSAAQNLIISSEM